AICIVDESVQNARGEHYPDEPVLIIPTPRRGSCCWKLLLSPVPIGVISESDRIARALRSQELGGHVKRVGRWCPTVPHRQPIADQIVGVRNSVTVGARP